MYLYESVQQEAQPQGEEMAESSRENFLIMERKEILQIDQGR